MEIKFKRLVDIAIAPTKHYSSDAGFDLYAAEDVEIFAGETKLVTTGLAFELPVGYELQVRPRSGVSLDSPLKVILGTVDAGYRGEVGIIVYNSQQVEYASMPRLISPILKGDNDFNITKGIVKSISIHKGDKIAQAIIQKLPNIELIESDELNAGDRGLNGFGSTGV